MPELRPAEIVGGKGYVIMSKYMCEGQIDMFDFFADAINESNEEQIGLFDFLANEADVPKIKKYSDINMLKEALVFFGTGFEDGRKRVYYIIKDKALNKQEKKERIKKEFGLGGAYWHGNEKGVVGYDTFGNKYKVVWEENGEEQEASFSWEKVVAVLEELVKTGIYYEKKKAV